MFQVRFLVEAPMQNNNAKYESIIDGIINDKIVLDSEINVLKELLNHWDSLKDRLIGKRAYLISTTDPYTNLKPGALGIVNHVDDAGTIFVDWDCGSKLGLIPGIDFFEVLI
jgi:hypothetical protein